MWRIWKGEDHFPFLGYNIFFEIDEIVFKKGFIHFTASALKQRRLEKSPKSPQAERVTDKEASIQCIEVRK